MVIWFIGLSGSGKTFYAQKLFNILKKKIKVITIDGDEVRKFINYDLGYNIKDRKKNSILISNLCNFLEKKGFLVICSILSICPEHPKRKRKMFDKYIQIYLKAKVEKIIKRNNKNIYDKNKKNIVGKNIRFPNPYKSDLTIENNFDNKFGTEINSIIKKINAKKSL